jgi:transcriptional regulator with XRE-family HTH domain
MTMGERIKQLRKGLGMSQDDLADAIGANRVTISRYETDTYYPSVPALERLAVALRTTPSKLTGGTDEDSDKWELSESIRRDPNLRMLFGQARKAKPEHIRAAAAMLKSLEGETDD